MLPADTQIYHPEYLTEICQGSPTWVPGGDSPQRHGPCYVRRATCLESDLNDGLWPKADVQNKVLNVRLRPEGDITSIGSLGYSYVRSMQELEGEHDDV